MSGLFQDSGSSPEDRRREASKIIAILINAQERLNPDEVDFVESLEDGTRPVSARMLFWLRDIKSKYE